MRIALALAMTVALLLVPTVFWSHAHDHERGRADPVHTEGRRGPRLEGRPRSLEASRISGFRGASSSGSQPARGDSEAWICRGTVRTPAGSPIADANVVISWSGEEVATVPCDRQGRFAHELAALRELSPLTRRSKSLTVRAVAPGHGPHQDQVRVLENGDVVVPDYRSPRFPARAKFSFPRTGSLCSDLFLVRAAVLVGRAVTPTGEPVGGAAVVLTATDDTTHRDNYVACTEADGSFLIAVQRLGPYMLTVTHVDHGSARIERVSPKAANETRSLDLVLRGEEYLEGVVEHADLGPVWDLLVVAREASTTRGMTQGFHAPLPCFDDLVRDEAIARTRTNANGAFRIPLRVHEGPWTPPPAKWWGVGLGIQYAEGLILVPVGPHAPGARGINLKVRGHFLRIRVVDARGDRVHDVRVRARRLHSGSHRPSGSAPATEQEGGNAEALLLDPIRTGAAVEVLLPHGSTWLLTADTEGGECSRRRVEIPVNEIRSDVLLVMREVESIAGKAPDMGADRNGR